MKHFKSIAYVLILGFLLSYPPIVNSQKVIPVTYRAEFKPFDNRLTRQEIISLGDGVFGLEYEVASSPSVTAKLVGEILFHEGNRTIQVRGTDGGHLSSNGSLGLKGSLVMDFIVPLPEAFFEEDESIHIKHKVKIPELDINMDLNISTEINEIHSLRLRRSNTFFPSNDSWRGFLMGIRGGGIDKRLSAVEVVPIVANAILSGYDGDLPAAAKIFVDNLSDYLKAGIFLKGAVDYELSLRGKAIIVNGTAVTHESGAVRAPGFDPTEGTYHIQSRYDEEFRCPLDFVASNNAYMKIAVLRGIEIWSYDNQSAEKRVPIIPENTFDLDFGETTSSVKIDVPPDPGNTKRIPGLIPDPNLSRLVRLQNGLGLEEPITQETILKVTQLSANSSGIRSLKDLGHAVNLTTLILSDNAISNVSALSGLTNLIKLDLSDNAISNVSALSGLTNLIELDIDNNPLSEVSLSGLPNLRSLELENHTLSEVSLSGLSNLKRLILSRNTISKLSLSGLPNLEASLIGFGSNVFTEVSLSDIPDLERLRLSDNVLTKVSLSGLPNLTLLDFQNCAISDVSFLSGLANLTTLNLENNAISDVSPLLALQYLTTLNLRNNSISDVSFLSGLPNLTTLSLENNAISDVSPLSYLANLTTLNLENNSISDVSSLSGLLGLTRLDLSNNALTEVSLDLSLLELPIIYPSLTRLDLSDNPLTKVSLSGFRNLTDLTITNESGYGTSTDKASLTEVSLSRLLSLTGLTLRDSALTKVSLSFLPSLTYLSLSNNALTEVSLSGLTSLEIMDLRDNALTEVSLPDLPNLKELLLDNNSISDVSPLTELPNLRTVYLYGNPLDSASRHTHIPAMQAREVEVWFDERWTPILVKISGEGQTGKPGTVLPTPFLVQTLDVEDKPMSRVSIRFVVYEGGGTLSDTTATTNATGKAQTTLTLGPDPGTNKIAVIAEEFKAAVSFTATATLDIVTPLRTAEDVNGDGVVNIQDLVLVSASLGQVGENEADVNADSVVNIQDLVLVAAALQ